MNIKCKFGSLRKAIAYFLCAVLIFSIIPQPTYAVGNEVVTEDNVSQSAP